MENFSAGFRDFLCRGQRRLCGGGRSSLSDKDNSNNKEENSQPNVQDNTVVIDENMIDSDGDGTPDLLDFEDIEQKYYGENDSVQGIKISSISSRHYLKNFKDFASFSADLTAGTKYTIEISESAGITGVKEVADYAYPIGNNIPDIEVINPQGKELGFLDMGTYDENYDVNKVVTPKNDEIELSVYPNENPYIVCYTFTPSVTGSYTIKFSAVDSSDVSSSDLFEHVATLFVYEEVRDGTEKNEAGYYKRYKFRDKDGNLSNTISMNDIMELTKAYNSLVYDTLSTALELDGNSVSDDLDEWSYVASDDDAQDEAYIERMLDIKPFYGIFDDTVESQEKTIVGYTISDDDDDETTTSSVSVFSPAITTASTSGTQIKQELYGIPYKDEFRPGTGYFAITGVQATLNAVKGFTLEVPAKKNVKSNYSATFVSSQEDREKISKTTADASLSIGGFGLGASYSSESKFKFGLTSTTFVIHYDELESGYRTLDDEDYQFKNRALTMMSNDLTQFRNRYGDYFVGGYKYGGTYDAFITITTKTVEQIETVKTKLSASFASSKFATSADVGNETSETLKQNDARISIQIKTAGIDTTELNIPAETTNISDVIKSLNDFRTALRKTEPKDYQPVYVMLKRYTLLDDYQNAMDKHNDSGLIPINPKHSSKILSFNRVKLEMDSYYNVIADLTDAQIDSSVRNKYKNEYQDLVDEFGTGGNAFYAESNVEQMNALKTKMENLSVRLKALGDRFVFYQRLVSAQKKEEDCSTVTDVKNKPFGYNGGYVGDKSFGVSTAVTSDIAAGRQQSDFRNQYSGKSREPTFDAGSGYVFCHVDVTANNTHDVARTADLY